MAKLPLINLIYASDAAHHSGKLQEIIQNLKTENRVEGYSTLNPDDDLSYLADNINEKDLVLVLLTKELEPHRERIETRFRELVSDRPGIKIAEILIDNVKYDNDYITFPGDLRPIRNREDMDQAWSSIEQNLKTMFPARKKEKDIPIDWTKYLKIAVPVIIVLLLLFWGLSGGEEDSEQEMTDSTVTDTTSVESSLLADFSPSETSCEAPCTIDFENQSEGADSYSWTFGDNDNANNRENPTYTFQTPGTYQVRLTATKSNGQTQEHIEEITIRQENILADFSPNSTSCEVPCEIKFINTSENAETYRWDFGDGNSSNERSPVHTYNQAGSYKATLRVQNGNQRDWKESDLITVRVPIVFNVEGIFEAAPDSDVDGVYVQGRLKNGSINAGDSIVTSANDLRTVIGDYIYNVDTGSNVETANSGEEIGFVIKGARYEDVGRSIHVIRKNR